MPTPLIDIKDAWKIYHLGEVEIPAVCGVSMSIPPGQFVAISGASGSGKSTFMHLVGCLDRPTRGSYTFQDRSVDQLDRKELAKLRNRCIGFVFQNFNLLARTTILDNVALPLAYQGVGLRRRRRKAEEVLVRLGLQDRLKHHPNQISGGQQQRVAIARALVTEPVLILADEPTGNLDSKTSAEIMELFDEFNKTDKMTIILVTHEADIAAHATRHIVFHDGRIVADDDKEMDSAA